MTRCARTSSKALSPTTTATATANRKIYPDHKGETIRKAVGVAEEYIAENPMGTISIRLDKNKAQPGAPFYNPDRIKDFFYYMIGPLLPARAHTLEVQRREEVLNAKYTP
ncbi:MAG: hypothetical protein REI11_08040, partial [Patulibacter sp.]|nr:hypothetical protein [Patulibacter sp.]